MAVLMHYDYGQRMGSPASNEITTLPSIQQAVPQILEAIPPNRDSLSSETYQLPTHSRSLASLHKASISTSPSHSQASIDNICNPISQSNPGRNGNAWETGRRESRMTDSPCIPGSSNGFVGGTSPGSESRTHHPNYPQDPVYPPPPSIQDASRPYEYGQQPQSQRAQLDSARGRRSNPLSANGFKSTKLYDSIGTQTASVYDLPAEGSRAPIISGQPKSEPMSPSYPPSPYESQDSGGFSQYGGTSPPYMDQSKRRRGNLPKAVTDLLRKWFLDHSHHPYPSEDEKQMLMQQTGLSMAQISNWFINARRRQPKSNSN
ncbi:MAG: hypothetical protein M1814_006765 [Vezdaea aestivalis]|nr:MAG: hypothetical protein M1814_006765 [Vezdaea aestivalis]